MTIRGFFFTAAALAGLAATTAAHAGERASADAPPTMRVFYGDLNVSDPAAAKVLMVRLKRAAAEVCGYWSDAWNTTPQRDMNRCMTAAVDGAVSQIDQTRVATGKAGLHPLLLAEAKTPTR